MLKIISFLFVLSAITVYHPDAEAQRTRTGSGGSRTGGGSSNRSSGSSNRSSGSTNRSKPSTSSPSRTHSNNSNRSSSPSTPSRSSSNSSSTNRNSGRVDNNTNTSPNSSSRNNGVNSGNTGRHSDGIDNGQSRNNSAAIPGMGRTTVVDRSQGKREISDFYNSRNEQVMRQSVSKRGDQMTRTFFERNDRNNRFYDTRAQRDFNYQRVVYRNNVNVWVYQPIYITKHYGYGWGYYGSFCHHRHYRSSWNYNWGWSTDPWWGYWGYYGSPYYHPYATYSYPSQWLVDYYWASLLADEYQDRVDANTISSQQSTISSQQLTIEEQQAEIKRQQDLIDGLKDKLAKQVDDEMLARRNGETISIDKKLEDSSHLYVMSESIDSAVTVNGSKVACNLSSGDVIQLAKEVGPEDTFAQMFVMSSKVGGCPAGSMIYISIERLQAFENELNRRLDLGTEKMLSDTDASSHLIDNDEE